MEPSNVSVATGVTAMRRRPEIRFATRLLLVAFGGVLATAPGCGDDGGATDGGLADSASSSDAHIVDGGLDGGAPDAATADAGVDADVLDAGVDAIPRLAACADPRDEDGDGLGGYPGDPGCVSRDDDDESDDCPAGPGCPRCSNGIDDDTDGVTDYPADIGCPAAGGDDEANICGPGLEVQPFVAPVTGDLVAGPSHTTASCAADSASSPEQVWALRVDEPLEALWFEQWGTSPAPLNTATLSVRDGVCDLPAAELACSSDPTHVATVAIGDPAPGTYYVLVEGKDGDLGTYGLEARAVVPSGARCTGAPYPTSCIPGEACDVRGDGLCHPVACADGVDNDGDGHADWPDDPGCLGPSGLLENDGCPGPTCPACANGVDDDLDGRTDHADRDCPYPGFPAEAVACPGETDPLIEITGPVVSGTTVGATSDQTLEMDHMCHDREVDHGAPDLVHWLYLAGMADIELVDRGSFGGLLGAVASDCGWFDFDACLDNGMSSLWRNVGPGYLFIVVDGDQGIAGAYSFTVSGRYHAGAPCDPDQITAGIMACAELTSCVDGVCRY
jgi:hypothetical protein